MSLFFLSSFSPKQSADDFRQTGDKKRLKTASAAFEYLLKNHPLHEHYIFQMFCSFYTWLLCKTRLFSLCAADQKKKRTNEPVSLGRIRVTFCVFANKQVAKKGKVSRFAERRGKKKGRLAQKKNRSRRGPKRQKSVADCSRPFFLFFLSMSDTFGEKKSRRTPFFFVFTMPSGFSFFSFALFYLLFLLCWP